MSSNDRPATSRTTRSIRSLTGRSIKSEPQTTRPQSSHSPPPVLRIPSIDHIEEKHEKRRRRESLAAMAAAAEAQALALAEVQAQAQAQGRSSDERNSTPQSFASVRNSNGSPNNNNHGSNAGHASNNSSTSTLSTPTKQTLFALSTRESVNWRRLEEPQPDVADGSKNPSPAPPPQPHGGTFRGGPERSGLDSPRSFVARGWAAASTALGSPRSGTPQNQHNAQPQRTTHFYSHGNGKSRDLDVEKGSSHFYGSAVAITTGGPTAVPMPYRGLGREGERSPRGRRRDVGNGGGGGDSVLRAWGWEMLSLLVAVAAFVSMITMLSNVHGRPLASLPFHLPALLALLATLTKAALLLPVSSSIGQFKWLWLTAPTRGGDDRPLTDMQRFDDASRGVTGSLRFLARPSRWLSFAALGALVTIAAFALSPVAQLAVAYVPAPSSTVGNNTSSFFTDPSLLATNSAGLPTLPALRSLTSPPDTESAVLAAVLTPPNAGPVADLAPTCPSGNCAFPAFRTLALCARAVDTTGLLRTTSLPSSGPADWTTWPNATNVSLGDGGASVAGPVVGGGATNVSMHDGEWFVAPAGTVGVVSAASTVTAPGALGGGGNGGVVDEATVLARVNLVWATTPGQAQAFNAQQLLFYLCVQQQTVTVRDGATTVKRETIAASANPPSATPLTTTECGRRDDDDWGHHYPQACNVSPTNPSSTMTLTASTGETFTAAAPAVAAMGNFLLQFFPGYASAFPSGSNAAAYADTGDTQLGRIFRAVYPVLAVSTNTALSAPAVGAAAMQTPPASGDPAAGAASRVATLAGNIGTSLTNGIRLSSSSSSSNGASSVSVPGSPGGGGGGGRDGSADTSPIAGTPLGPSVLLVAVRWPVLALPAACLALACALLTGAIVATAIAANAGHGKESLTGGGSGGDQGHPGAGAAVKNSALALVFALKRRGIMTGGGGSGGVGGASVVGLRGKKDMEREAVARGMRVGMVGGGAVVVAAAGTGGG